MRKRMQKVKAFDSFPFWMKRILMVSVFCRIPAQVKCIRIHSLIDKIKIRFYFILKEPVSIGKRTNRLVYRAVSNT